MPITPAPETVTLVRRLYAEGETIRAIVAATGITNIDTIMRCVRGEFPDLSGERPPPLPQRRPGARVYARKGTRTALVKSLLGTAQKQVEEIDQRLKIAGLSLPERESNTRMLATLAKTLRELAAFDETQKPKGAEAQDKDDDDPVPQNMDEFRRELARRIRSLIESRTASRRAD